MGFIGRNSRPVIYFRQMNGSIGNLKEGFIPNIPQTGTNSAKIKKYRRFHRYTAKDSLSIQEITVNFDDHGYAPSLRNIYNNMCYYTLKVFFPDFPKDKIVELYTTLNRLAYEYFTEIKYTSESIPSVLYYKDGIGLYPDFAEGKPLGNDKNKQVITIHNSKIESISALKKELKTAEKIFQTAYQSGMVPKTECQRWLWEHILVLEERISISFYRFTQFFPPWEGTYPVISGFRGSGHKNRRIMPEKFTFRPAEI